MTTHSDHARMTLDLPVQEHKKLKAMAAFMGVSLKDLVLSCVRENLLGYVDEPNAETIKAFKETDEGKGLIHCDDFDDFVAKLGLK